MQNINCLQCSRTREYNLLSHDIIVKNYNCSRDGEPYTEKVGIPKLQVSIMPTDICICNCPFCIADNNKDRKFLDIKKLENALMLLKKEDIVRGISISGGEPFTDVELLNEIIIMIYEMFGENMEVSLNTSGVNLDKMHKIEKLHLLEALHISRHHYDDKINDELFGHKMPSNEQLKEILHSVVYKDLFVLNCMLLKDYIGSVEEVHKYFEFAIEMGAGKVSFITGTPVNDFVKSQVVNYNDVLKKEDENLLFTRFYQDFEWCNCKDGLYVSKNGEMIHFYGRATNAGDCEYTRGLVYTHDNRLLTGYKGVNLL